MLKRLELIGFKSFADKTAFEFGPGITAIVGPNGSGKSNIVDGVRWILGEQSAKSLRGGEMADVIFNGSTSRRGLGMAEVSLTMDNTRGLLATAAQEVRITRRVYRSGEGEYLINQQACRLKDIKDLFLGSGAGSDAYCIIAQGRVDVLLQASTQERRTVIEEAAGISRFKVKKAETLRKLERVDQNVNRLRDIIDEVEKQLRSVRLQAAKAQRYQEYAGRLRELRLGLGLKEYHQLAGSLDEAASALDSLRRLLDQRGSQVRGWEEEHATQEQAQGRVEEELHEQEANLAHARQQIKAQETTLRHEANLTDNLTTELSRLRQQANDMAAHVAALVSSLERARQELEQADAQASQQRQAAQTQEQGLQVVEERLHLLGDQVQKGKAQHLEQMRQSARLQNDAVTFKAQIDNLQRELNRLRQKTEQAAESLATLDHEMQELSEAEMSLQNRLAQARDQLGAEKAEGERLRRSRDATSDLISELRQQRSGLVSRAEVLEGLERSHEGLGTGVGEVLDILAQPAQSGDAANPWQRAVVGMVADFLSVRREYAPLIDLALGDWAQRFLVRDTALLLDAVKQRSQTFSSRVSFLPLTAGSDDEPSGPGAVEVSLLGPSDQAVPTELLAQPGIVARADQVVRCDHAELAALPVQLLGRTLIVQDLETAHRLAPLCRGFRLITLQGELREADGTLTVGTYHADTGILSRKSELQDVREQIGTLDRRLGTAESELGALRESIAVSESRAGQHQQETQVLSEQAVDLRSRLEMQRDRRQGLHDEVSVGRDEMQRAEQEAVMLQRAWQQARDQATQSEARVQALQSWIEQAEAHMRQLEQARHERRQQSTESKVALAQVEERTASLRNRHELLATDLDQRRQEARQGHDTLQACRSRLRESQRIMLLASADLADGYAGKEQAERAVARLLAERDRVRHERCRLGELLHSVRGEWQQQQEQFHAQELQVNELRYKRDTLCDRLREDYQLELAELHQQALAAGLWPDEVLALPSTETETMIGATAAAPALPVSIPADAQAATEEIEELRRKLNRLGSVNLDSLTELADLEVRAATLNAQYDDLAAAKRALEEIIGKINSDSRRLFAETFATVRGHFQELFRKLFGGGMADIVLEDENDILESGIDIVARPPGKDLRSISLMSGGEKTLTAVALLLAIFRSKPSPFCILDEVDAALDEANIGRFADVLREFLDSSHFIIITHSKRTMAAADAIYGITMQESGISKRVSVRFDDWDKYIEAGPAEAKQEVA